MNEYDVAIIGSGPAGLSAAAHAAEMGLSHVLFEKAPHHANTIHSYQKGKHVMSEPGILPLRSDLEFQAGKRETVLDDWKQGLDNLKVNAFFTSEVTAIDGKQGDFNIEVNHSEIHKANYIVLAMGVQGNPRKLGVPGEDHPIVNYTLDDPDDFSGQSIIVVGAGDAAIENALALAKDNKVHIINRRDEFARAKQGNLTQIMEHINAAKIICHYNSSINRIEETNSQSGNREYDVILNTPEGELAIKCHHLIARLGAIPPRKFVESAGIEFSGESQAALPSLTAKFESTVEGLFIIGALGGYPLIKQAMNQGYEVIEYILGNDIKSADHDLLAKKLQHLPFDLSVDESLNLLRDRIPMYRQINPLLFREFILDSEIKNFHANESIYKKNDYTNSFFTLISGKVALELEQSSGIKHEINAKEVFGEQSLISGRRRAETVVALEDSVVVETPRRTMVKLINSNENIQIGIDQIFIGRALQSSFVPNTPIEKLDETIKSSKLEVFSPGQIVYSEGDVGDHLYLIRTGSLVISRLIGDRDVVTAYLPTGSYVGELGLMGNRERLETVRAAVRTETISIGSEAFLGLLETEPALKRQVQSQVQKKLDEEARLAATPDAGDVLHFFMQEGLGESTDVLLINESLCIGCDNCEKACADTHQGTSRLDRKAGASYAAIHVPISCRHCEHPHCMKDCPPDAIHRSPGGEVFIDDSCIGCGNCENNCPYDVIHMAYDVEYRPSLFQWLLTGMGISPGEDISQNFQPGPDDVKKAVKCDMCKDITGGASCVRACPTGAAIRVSPEQYVDVVSRRS